LDPVLRKVEEIRVARGLLSAAGMDAAEFDRLVARARDPRLIPAIYNYCDGRCPRCPFTQRCLTFLDTEELKASDGSSRPLADIAGEALQRTLEMLAEAARRDGIDLGAEPADAQEPPAEADPDQHRRDPLAVRARAYGQLAWRVARAIAPIAAARDDATVIEAVKTIEWFSSMISAKLYRAICGYTEGWESPDEAQTDFNGSAKIALIGIGESRQAWGVLMEEGRATADGVPAQAVRMLEALDAEVRERFPRVMAFVRPGFDDAEAGKGGAR
jgi:hypothetical protein